MSKGKLREWYAEIAVRYMDGQIEPDKHCIAIKAKNIISAVAKAKYEADQLVAKNEDVFEASVWSVELADYEDDEEAYFDGYTREK